MGKWYAFTEMAQVALLNVRPSPGNENFQWISLPLSGGCHLGHTHMINLLKKKRKYLLFLLLQIPEVSWLPSGVHFNSKHMRKMKDYWNWSEWKCFSSMTSKRASPQLPRISKRYNLHLHGTYWSKLFKKSQQLP